jgi:uracil-DNA glycosylase
MDLDWFIFFKKYYEETGEELQYENAVVYPKKKHIYKVFEMNVKDIKLVILGQDPYHNKNQAHGLSFSTSNIIPPSLRNIFKELQLNFKDRNYNFTHGNLTRWHKEEGIFLLNTALTVEENLPLSHIKKWNKITDAVIKYISDNSNCVFLLLGNQAKAKDIFISNKKRIVYEKHPSPLARGFIGSNVFIRIESVLGNKINWQN